MSPPEDCIFFRLKAQIDVNSFVDSTERGERKRENRTYISMVECRFTASSLATISFYCQAAERWVQLNERLIKWDNDEITVSCSLTLASPDKCMLPLSQLVLRFLLTYRVTHRDFFECFNWFFFFRATRFHSAQSTANVVNVANADNWAVSNWMQTDFFNVWKRHSHYCAQLTFCVQQPLPESIFHFQFCIAFSDV